MLHMVSLTLFYCYLHKGRPVSTVCAHCLVSRGLCTKHIFLVMQFDLDNNDMVQYRRVQLVSTVCYSTSFGVK